MKYLREASKAPKLSQGTDFPPATPFYRLCKMLLDNKRTGDVIELLERFSEIDDMGKDQLLASAAELRGGAMPDWYRRTT